MHAKFCDHQLQTCPHLPPEGRDNLLKQKTNLQQQMKLVNEQINLYRVSVCDACLARDRGSLVDNVRCQGMYG